MAKNVFNPEITFENVCISNHVRRGHDVPSYATGHFEADTVEYDIPYINGKIHLEYAVFHVHEPKNVSCSKDVDMVGVYRIPLHDCKLYTLKHNDQEREPV